MQETVQECLHPVKQLKLVSCNKTRALGRLFRGGTAKTKKDAVGREAAEEFIHSLHGYPLKTLSCIHGEYSGIN